MKKSGVLSLSVSGWVRVDIDTLRVWEPHSGKWYDATLFDLETLERRLNEGTLQISGIGEVIEKASASQIETSDHELREI